MDFRHNRVSVCVCVGEPLFTMANMIEDLASTKAEAVSQTFESLSLPMEKSNSELQMRRLRGSREESTALMPVREGKRQQEERESRHRASDKKSIYRKRII